LKWLHRFVVGIVVASRVASAAACSLQDIEIRQANWRREFESYIRIVGELYNGCSDAVGVELQAVFRDKAGQVVVVEEFWPANTRNIAAKDIYAFSHVARNDQPIEAMSIKIIDVKRW
jgi:hypothetical protein